MQTEKTSSKSQNCANSLRNHTGSPTAPLRCLAIISAIPFKLFPYTILHNPVTFRTVNESTISGILSSMAPDSRKSDNIGPASPVRLNPTIQLGQSDQWYVNSLAQSSTAAKSYLPPVPGFPANIRPSHQTANSR